MRVRGGLSILVLLSLGVSCAGRSSRDCAASDCSEVVAGSGGKGGASAGSSGGSLAGREAFGGAGGTGVGGVETGGTGGAGGDTGGTGVAGGSSGAAGAGGGGASATGGTSPAGGSGNVAGEAGGTSVDCSLPPESGSCSAAFQRWYYSSSGVCEPFIYGGCGANSNHFETEEECLAACQGQAMNDGTTCASPSECVVIDRACCSCEASSRDSLVAVNVAHAGLRCAAVDCLPCLPVEDPNRAWFGATCTDGHCRLFDARQSAITECTDPADCTLRWGLACCESCAPLTTGPVAVNLSAGFSALVCGDEPAGCDDCIVPDTAPYVPWCNDGRCEAEAIVN